MAETDPTKDQGAIRLRLPRRDRTFLQEVVTMVRDGLREELAGHGEERRRPGCMQRELDAYERLHAALEGRRVFPDPELRDAVAELARMIDESNEHSRVVAEHEAMHRLLASLDRSRAPCSRRSTPCAAIRCRGDSPTPRR
jgi:hypothetical protein